MLHILVAMENDAGILEAFHSRRELPVAPPVFEMQDIVLIVVTCLEIGRRLARAGIRARIGMDHAISDLEQGAGRAAICRERGIGNAEIVQIFAVEERRPPRSGLKRQARDQQKDRDPEGHFGQAARQQIVAVARGYDHGNVCGLWH